MLKNKGFSMISLLGMMVMLGVITVIVTQSLETVERQNKMVRSQMNKQNMIRLQALLASKARDIDNDGIYELLAPTENGTVPLSVPSGDLDIFGKQIKYCAFDNGLKNIENNEYTKDDQTQHAEGVAGRIISGGENGKIESECSGKQKGDDLVIDILLDEIKFASGEVAGFLGDGKIVKTAMENATVGIGTHNPEAPLHIFDQNNPGIVVEGNNLNDNTRPYLGLMQTGGGPSYGPSVLFAKSGFISGNKTATPSGVLGSMNFMGYTGNNYVDVAKIDVQTKDILAQSHESILSFCTSKTKNAGMEKDKCLTLDSEGFVNIGSNEPAKTKLDVNGTLNIAGKTIYFEHDGQLNIANSFIKFDNNTYNFMAGQNRENINASAHIKANIGMFNTVGVNTNNTLGYALYVNGQSYTTGIWEGSDARLKTNITSLNNVTEKIFGIHGVSFYYRQDIAGRNFPKEKQIGFIAQEVEKYYPELVDTGPDGLKSVNYNRMVPILLEVVKNQEQRIQDLEKKINENTRSSGHNALKYNIIKNKQNNSQ